MENRRNLYLVAYVFQIIATCLFAWTFVTLAWMIPMTIATKQAMDEKSTNDHLALGICTLLFQSLIAGIFILVANGTKVNPVEEKFNDENKRNDLDYI